MMKAVVHEKYGLPSQVLKVRDIAMPAVADNDVLVRVRAAGGRTNRRRAVIITPASGPGDPMTICC